MMTCKRCGFVDPRFGDYCPNCGGEIGRHDLNVVMDLPNPRKDIPEFKADPLTWAEHMAKSVVMAIIVFSIAGIIAYVLWDAGR